MSATASVQAYIQRQPRLAWRRYLLRFLIRTLGYRVLWKVDVRGMDNIPATGSTILMMNHISGIDPVLCMGAATHRYVIPMTKIENAQHPILGAFVRWYGAYTVSRGEVDRSALMNSIELLRSGQLILIAPEGTRSPEGLIEPKDGLTYVATKADAVIVPTAISGAVGWEDKLKHLKRAHVRVDFGKPFKFKTNGNTRIPRDELALMTQEAMYQLALTLP
ncbi:MAG TPA: lysophospholipid acyltransferase family protein, partial [Phototrophicaceae bacterium]|nr:lysophospholipid acyltransferase family protein [Phototrophicaceae bacterium]